MYESLVLTTDDSIIKTRSRLYVYSPWSKQPQVESKRESFGSLDLFQLNLRAIFVLNSVDKTQPKKTQLHIQLRMRAQAHLIYSLLFQEMK